MKFKKHLAITLALSTALGVGTITPTITHPTKVEAADFTYTKDQQDALNHLNFYRKAIGLPQVKLNPFLNKAAQNHANYIQITNITGHIENKSKNGYTGEEATDRIKAVGGNLAPGIFHSEVISYSKKTVEAGIDELFDTAYHRSTLTNPDVQEIGIGFNERALVIDTASYNTSETEDYYTTKDYHYPYNGQKNIPIGFYGRENPNPIKKFGVTQTGTIILFSTPFDYYIEDLKFTLKDSKGVTIPSFEEIAYGSGDSFFYPKQVLKYNETYTASVTYSDSYTGTKRSKTWSFTTEANPITAPPVVTKPTTPTQPIQQCKPSTKKVWWRGVELKKGQIGLATIVKDTPLYKLEGTKKTFSRTLKKGETYRIYKFVGSTALGLGAGHYVDRDSRVKYETPSKTKLAEVNCQ